MTEYVASVDLYLLADSQEEAEAMTHAIVDEVFSRPDVIAVGQSLTTESDT